MIKTLYIKTLQVAIIISTIFMFSCEQKSEAQIKRNALPGTYFDLEKDNIKIFLPVYFEAFSEDAYETLIDAHEESYEKELEKNRFNFLKFSKGNNYFFKDIASSTLVNVKMMNYLPFTKKESSQLLGIISKSCNDYAKVLQTNCKKITAGYSENYVTKVFKAVYEISNDTGYLIYNNIYLISSRHKTFSINIYSKTDQNFNSFIEKIQVE
ncbi:hypothetical protein FG167_11225 [Lacinutrix sp. WUR7]|uniref:hypothetical protein n=1 Tax=Lacinutrix sp. WUR7 TaxID=2653681 RepID=UPI00193DA8B1|nr:hypothetical protein [Lacinutrix sp. WUR7]QRM89774.1 hypothetical protein FG167_11225 [Lacinutrix sp. WUR7]